MLLRNCLFITVGLLLVFSQCKKAEEYPIEPVITFKSLTTIKDANGYDTQGILEFEFTDGDGDIGLNASDTLAPYIGEYSKVVHAVFYYFSNGSWLYTPHLSPNGDDDRSTIPVITPEGNQKAIRGIIRKDHIGFPINVTNLRVRFEVYIYDRALHKSNVITTSEIVINTF
jgi:hypothetical protein